MKSIKHLLILTATFISFSSIAQAGEQEIRLKITSRVGNTFLGSTKDGRVLSVVCTPGWTGKWSADLVFPADSSSGALPEITFETYRSTHANLSSAASARSPYRPFSAEDAANLCAQPAQEFIMSVSDTGAQITGTRAITVQSFGVGRRYL